MKALRFRRYGPPEALEWLDAPEPRGEVIVRVRAAALNPKDTFLRKGKPAWTRLMGGRPPQGVGFDFAGEREDTGARVYGCLDGFRGGAMAERVGVAASKLAPIPAGLGFIEAAAIPVASLTALQALRDKGGLRPGGRVLIYGASGGVGSAAVQLAKALGAAHVTSASGEANLTLCRSLGADTALDYRRDALPPPGPFDVVFDTMGLQRLGAWRGSLAAGGRLVSTVPSPGFLLSTLATRQARMVTVHCTTADLLILSGFVEAGRFKPLIDSVFPIADAVKAFRHLETRRARGKIVLEVAPS